MLLIDGSVYWFLLLLRSIPGVSFIDEQAGKKAYDRERKHRRCCTIIFCAVAITRSCAHDNKIRATW
jgi:hypothetical protein